MYLWNQLIVAKRISSKLFKSKMTNKLFTYKSYMYNFLTVR